MAQEPEYAEDVTDLREAQRIIAALRRDITTILEGTQPALGEFTAFLDEKHTQMLLSLYELRQLYDDQDPEDDVDDAFSVFVSDWLEVWWDIVRERERVGGVTPSA